jgi:hypothetical protein
VAKVKHRLKHALRSDMRNDSDKPDQGDKPDSPDPRVTRGFGSRVLGNRFEGPVLSQAKHALSSYKAVKPLAAFRASRRFRSHLRTAPPRFGHPSARRGISSWARSFSSRSDFQVRALRHLPAGFLETAPYTTSTGGCLSLDSTANLPAATGLECAPKSIHDLRHPVVVQSVREVPRRMVVGISVK